MQVGTTATVSINGGKRTSVVGTLGSGIMVVVEALVAEECIRVIGEHIDLLQYTSRILLRIITCRAAPF